MEARSLYEIFAIKDLKKLKINKVWKEVNNVDKKIEKCYEDLKSCFINAHKNLITFYIIFPQSCGDLYKIKYFYL
jgi:hypothetical protein